MPGVIPSEAEGSQISPLRTAAVEMTVLAIRRAYTIFIMALMIRLIAPTVQNPASHNPTNHAHCFFLLVTVFVIGLPAENIIAPSRIAQNDGQHDDDADQHQR